MTGNGSDTPTSALHRAVDTVDALGLTRPPHLTLRRYLTILVDHGLAAEPTVGLFLEAYGESSFGNQRSELPDPTAIADQLTLEVTRSVEASPTAFRDAERALSALASAMPLLPDLQVDTEPETLTDEAASLPNEPEQTPIRVRDPKAQEPDGRTTSLDALEFKVERRTRHALATFMFLLWTGVAVMVGYATHDHIGRGLHDLTAHILDLPYSLGSGDHHLESARRTVGTHPDSIGAWRSYADQAFRRNRDAEGVVALHRLISLQPNNALTLNELAWLLCTADEATVRDPVRALELAERAFALNPSPAITDTLAEAAFQNGDPRRAIALEEDALARLTTGQEHYLRQLERFRAAVGDP